MNINFTLFDNFLAQHPIKKDEAAQIENIAAIFFKAQSSVQGFHFPDSMSDSMVIGMLKCLDIPSQQKSYELFIRHIFHDGYFTKISSKEIKKYLLIEFAKKSPLNRYVDIATRTNLAYSALHGSSKTREILMQNFKHFDLDDTQIIEDIALKSILLGNHLDFDTHQMMPMELSIIKKLIAMIYEKDAMKGMCEKEKLKTYYPDVVF